MPDQRPRYRLLQTAWGWLALIGFPDILCELILPQTKKKVLHELAARRLLSSDNDDSLFTALAPQLQSYFAAQPVQFTATVDLSWATAFTAKVLQYCCHIKLGQTSTYRQLAAAIRRPTAFRAVGGALGRNPTPIIIPCHRVLKQNGQLGGYSAPAGLKFKRQLLQLETQMLHVP